MEELIKHTTLRQHIMANIQLADNKAAGIMANYGESVAEIRDLYLEVISPQIAVANAPEGYEVFESTEIEHIKFECKVCKEILMSKLNLIGKMIRLAKSYEDSAIEYNKMLTDRIADTLK